MNLSVNFGKDQQPGLKNKDFESTDGVFFKEINNSAGKATLKLGIVVDLFQSTNLGMIPSDVFEIQYKFSKLILTKIYSQPSVKLKVELSNS